MDLTNKIGSLLWVFEVMLFFPNGKYTMCGIHLAYLGLGTGHVKNCHVVMFNQRFKEQNCWFRQSRDPRLEFLQRSQSIPCRWICNDLQPGSIGAVIVGISDPTGIWQSQVLPEQKTKQEQPSSVVAMDEAAQQLKMETKWLGYNSGTAKYLVIIVVNGG